MWRRVPCERQLNMGQSVLRDPEKSGTQSQIYDSLLSKRSVDRGLSVVFLERELG